MTTQPVIRFLFPLVLLLSVTATASLPVKAQAAEASLVQQLAALEAEAQGRIGIAALHTGSGHTFTYRGDERFPLCSTFKVLLTAAILKRSETETTLLETIIDYEQKDLVSWSPITEHHVDTGMTIAALCAAAMEYSDNTAANLLMKVLGGPQAVTAFARTVGDTVFSLDRWETELNAAEPGDSRDTTSPAAMAATLQCLTLGNELNEFHQQKLLDWLKGNTMGEESIRAALPSHWMVGDKTGGGAYGTTNDIAIIWPPSGSPIILAIYFTQPHPQAPPRKDVLAQATRFVLDAWP